MFLNELGYFDKSKKLLEGILNLINEQNLIRMPHWYNLKQPRIDMVDQIDGTFHIILAFADYCLKSNDKEFEDKYYYYIVKETIKGFSYPYFYDNNEKLPKLSANREDIKDWVEKVTDTLPVFDKDALNLIHNFYFEHSREYKMWNCFDMLSQSFAGAGIDKMIQLAEKRKDTKVSDWLKLKREAHLYGVDKNLTFEMNGKKMYLEMRVPTEKNPNGEPYDALGWPCFAPIAADWKGIDKDIYINTIEHLLLNSTIKDPVSKAEINMKEYYSDGTILPTQSLKMVGWSMEYLAYTKNYKRLADWIKFLTVNLEDGILTEILMPKDKEGNQLVYRGKILFDGDLPNDINWGSEDRGSAEQCIWFCRSVLRVINELKKECE